MWNGMSSAWALGYYLLNLRQQKTRYIAVTGFFNLKPGNVMVPTAVESHIANATLSSCRGSPSSWFILLLSTAQGSSLGVLALLQT